MNPTLVYLHIPKSAGSSHRAYMMRAVGDERVHWYGLDSNIEEFDANDLEGAAILGGHREMQFYPEGLNALYTAVVREPIERAVSYFNYCTTISSGAQGPWRKERERELAVWIDKGIDPQSMVTSIERCEDFRQRVSNYQCAYLSRFDATLADVKRTMQSENVIIGLFDDLDRFNRFFQLDLHFNNEMVVKSNIGDPGYSSGILAEPGLTELIASLNQEDQALYDFVRDECEGLCVSANNITDIREEVAKYVRPSNLQVEKGEFDWSRVELYCKGMSRLKLEKRKKIPVVIENRGQLDVVFTQAGDRSYGIGWILYDEHGQVMRDMRGVGMVKTTVRAGGSRKVKIDICIREEKLQGRTPSTIELCVVDSGTWMREKHPLQSAWIVLLA